MKKMTDVIICSQNKLRCEDNINDLVPIDITINVIWKTVQCPFNCFKSLKLINISLEHTIHA